MTGTKTRVKATASDWEWAEEVFQLPHTAQTGEALGTILKRLDDVDFMPLNDWRDAMDILATGHTTGTTLRAKQRTELIEELTEFLQTYWLLSLNERSKRYHELLERTEHCPEVRQLLEHVEPGLTVDAGPLEFEEDIHLQELGRMVCLQFLMGHAERAQSRRRWQSEYSADQRKQMARQFLAKYPKIAALEATWIQRLQRGESHHCPQKTFYKKVVQTASRVVDASNNSGFKGGAIAVVIGVAIGTCIAIFSDSPRSQNSSLTYPFISSQPKIEYKPVPIPMETFNQEQLKKLREETMRNPLLSPSLRPNAEANAAWERHQQLMQALKDLNKLPPEGLPPHLRNFKRWTLPKNPFTESPKDHKPAIAEKP